MRKTSAFCAPLRSPISFFLHSEINPVKQPQSFDHKSSFLSSSEQGLSPGFLVWQQEIKRTKKMTGNNIRREGGATGREYVSRGFWCVFPAKEVRPLRVKTQLVRRGRLSVLTHDINKITRCV